MPGDGSVRAAVTGQITGSEDGLHVEFHVHLLEELQEGITSKVAVMLTWEDPVAGLLLVSRRLARMLELPFAEPEKGLLTSSGPAFFRFLEGLDNAMLLSGDLAIEVQQVTAGLSGQELAHDPPKTTVHVTTELGERRVHASILGSGT